MSAGGASLTSERHGKAFELSGGVLFVSVSAADLRLERFSSVLHPDETGRVQRCEGTSARCFRKTEGRKHLRESNPAGPLTFG